MLKIKSISKRIIKFFYYPFLLVIRIEELLDTQLISETLFIRIYFRMTKNKSINLKDPRTFSEKIQVIKLLDRNEKYRDFVDKIKVKEYISNLIGAEYINSNIFVWDHPNRILYTELPQKFAIKCNHDSGSTIIVENWLSYREFKSILRRIKLSYNTNPYYRGREWAYKDIDKKVFIEELIPDKPNDYKVHVFGGKARFIQVDFDRFNNHTRTIYDRNWNKTEIEIHYPISTIEIEKPTKLHKIIELSELISSSLRYARIDWYIINNYLKFGEITLYPGSGQESILPEKYEFIFGNYIDLD